MTRNKHRPGEGCEFTCLMKHIHPQKKVQKRYPDYNKRDDELDGCLMLREGIKRTSGKLRKTFFFTHIEFPDEELHICRGFVTITKEGEAEGIFEKDIESNVETASNKEIPELSGDANEDVARFLAEGFVVDDDNIPAPENVPIENNPTNQNVLYEEWGNATHCNRARMFGRNETQPHLNNEPKTNDLLEWFIFFLPWDFFRSTIITATKNIIEGSPVSEGEFIRYLGIWLLMATVHSGTCRRSFWSLDPINPFEGAPFRCNLYMSYTRFEKSQRH